MISEPEFVGGVEFDEPEVLTETPPPRPPRPGRPWLWAVGGAVLASAVWGGGLYAYDQRKDPGPDLGGYKPAEGLCEVAKLKALTAVLGKRSQDGVGPFLNEPEVSTSSCSATFGPAETGQSLQVSYTLHKVIDPGPEFESWARQFGLLQAVGGVGEQAFFDDRGEEGGTLRVLDGQAEIELQIYRQDAYDDKGRVIESKHPVDLSGIDVPMTQDAIALLEALRK
ncbi:hypothetical protein ACFVZH_09510 [Streptomyces sp. NPDC059534]|uniref:hypothetical protein n=1 Tax=Streptomyces sp. NPDC059534 TaxID=3346859 RepID=UPI0036CD93B7